MSCESEFQPLLNIPCYNDKIKEYNDKIRQLQFGSYDLKKTALDESSALCLKICKAVKGLEIRDSMDPPKNFLSKLFRFTKHRKQIKEKKTLYKQILTLQKELQRTDDASKIDKLSQTILDIIENNSNSKKENSSEKILKDKIKLVRESYSRGIQGILIDVSNNFNLVKSRGNFNSTEKKINHLFEILWNSDNEQLTKSYTSALKIFAEADKKIVTMHFVDCKRPTVFKEVDDSLEQIKTKLKLLQGSEEFPSSQPCPRAVYEYFTKKIEYHNNKIESLKLDDKDSPDSLNKKLANKLANLHEDLNKLTLELHTFTEEFKAANEMYIEMLLLEEFTSEPTGFQSGETIVIPKDIQDLGSWRTAKANLSLLRQTLADRRQNIFDNYITDLQKAKTPADLKKIAYRCRLLVKETENFVKLRSKLCPSINYNMRIMRIIQDFPKDDVPDNQKEEIIKEYTLLLERAALLKIPAEKDLKIYIQHIDVLSNKAFDLYKKLID